MSNSMSLFIPNIFIHLFYIFFSIKINNLIIANKIQVKKDTKKITIFTQNIQNNFLVLVYYFSITLLLIYYYSFAHILS